MTVSQLPWSSADSLGAPETGCALWWLGQAGFLIEIGGLRIIIDAYLSDSLAEKYRGKKFPHIRMTQAPVAARDLKNIDWVLCTHGHTDHMDPGTIPDLMAANPNARVVVPTSQVGRAIERGVPADRMVSVNDGDRLDLGGVELFATPAAHETLNRDAEGNALFLGYALRGSGVTLWHSGDTIPFDGLVEAVAPLFIDIALLPVNGRDAVRAGNGVPGNLTLQEAVALSDRIGAGAMLGHHLDLFDFNTLDREEGVAWLAANVPDQSRTLVELGQRYMVAGKALARRRKMLAICRGNICRSPLAEAVLADLLNDRDEWEVDSAAIKDWNVGREPDLRSIDVARSHGLDLTGQRARQITPSDFFEFDLILAMDSDNCAGLAELAPLGASARILRLGDLIEPGRRHDIIDPYDFDRVEFEKCFQDISLACQNLVKNL